MLFISGEDMEKALEEFQDSEPSLEYRLWHVCANRIATSILMKQTAYQVSPFEQSRSYWADSHWSVCLLLVKQPVIGQKLLYLLMIWREGINAVHELVYLFQGWTKEKIKLQLENSYLLDSDDIDVFTVDSTMSDVVLINGVYFFTSLCRTPLNHQKVKLMLGIDQKTGIYKIQCHPLDWK